MQDVSGSIDYTQYVQQYIYENNGKRVFSGSFCSFHRQLPHTGFDSALPVVLIKIKTPLRSQVLTMALKMTTVLQQKVSCDNLYIGHFHTGPSTLKPALA